MQTLYPDHRPGHQADQAERLAVADLRLTRHRAQRRMIAELAERRAVREAIEVAANRIGSAYAKVPR